jgi:hypothetical protein
MTSHVHVEFKTNVSGIFCVIIFRVNVMNDPTRAHTSLSNLCIILLVYSAAAGWMYEENPKKTQERACYEEDNS